MRAKMKDWTGYRFGRLVVTRFEKHTKVNRRSVYKWECICECGVVKLYDINDLKKGSTNSCGCFRRQNQSLVKRAPEGIAALNSLYKSYKFKCAKDRNYDFELTMDEFKILTKNNCYYCGKIPSQVKKSKCSQYVYNGIDRVDNSLGYTTSNTVACCKDCNSKKSGVTRDIVFKLYEYFIKLDG